MVPYERASPVEPAGLHPLVPVSDPCKAGFILWAQQSRLLSHERLSLTLVKPASSSPCSSSGSCKVGFILWTQQSRLLSCGGLSLACAWPALVRL